MTRAALDNAAPCLGSSRGGGARVRAAKLANAGRRILTPSRRQIYKVLQRLECRRIARAVRSNSSRAGPGAMTKVTPKGFAALRRVDGRGEDEPAVPCRLRFSSILL